MSRRPDLSVWVALLDPFMPLRLAVGWNCTQYRDQPSISDDRNASLMTAVRVMSGRAEIRTFNRGLVVRF